MIKIHEKLWYVINPNREENLAYMTHYSEDAAFEKRKATGMSWANYGKKKNLKAVIVDNTPVKGIYIGTSVSRWSTSNKLFRVQDPRGFTVEVPTDNIATLLHLTTVINGIVQEECVWGREGNNHIILPVNSEPYRETLEKMDILENKLLSVKDLKVGDWFKVFEDSTEYYYAGRGKPVWEVTPYQNSSNHYYYGVRDAKTIDYPPQVIKEDKYTHFFLYKSKYKGKEEWSRSRLSGVPKIVEILRNEPQVIGTEINYMYSSTTVDNKAIATVPASPYHCRIGTERKLLGIEWKLSNGEILRIG